MKKRYKLYWGGRSGGKSYAFADSLLLLGRLKKLQIACMREIQESIKDSVYKLLCDRIAFYELSDYRIMTTKIINKITGTTIIFKGLQEQNADNIKSLEGLDIVWLEEAQKISKRSWEILDPTIRKPGSEIWISMNRERENDPVWAAVAMHPDERTIVIKVNYTDNPFCPEEMRYFSRKLISYKSVRQAMENVLDCSKSPLIIGLDVARFGDDRSVFCFRRGRVCIKFQSYSKLDNVEVANHATFFIRECRPQRIFIDAGGVGGGVIDILHDRGYKKIVRPVMFGAKALRDERYHNRRAEMWDELRQWLSGEIPVQLLHDENLCAELCAVNKKYDAQGRLQLEEKDEIKKKLGHSPDFADALALTFAEPLMNAESDECTRDNPNSIESMFRVHTKSTSW